MLKGKAASRRQRTRFVSGQATRRAAAPAVPERLELRRLFAGTPAFSTGFTAANTAGVVSLNGTTTINGTSLQLTSGSSSQVGTAFFTSPVSVQGFTTTFKFTQTGQGTLADGMTFTIQNVSPTEYIAAATGGGLGYALSSGNAGMPNSACVKFDLYSNSTEGNDSTGLFVNGDSPTVPSGSNAVEASLDMSSTGVKLTSGDPMQATLTYNGTTLSETVTDTRTNRSFSTTYAVNLPQTIGSPTAYVGFTAATGGSVSTQRVSAWTYSTTAVAPYAPTSLAATPASSTELDLSWADPYSAVTSYTVYRKAASGSFVSIGTTAGTTFADTGLTASTTYTYQVVATNSVGSATSATFTGTTPARPALVTNLTATGTTTSATTLNWQDGAGITGLTLTRTLVPDNAVNTVTLPVGTTTYTDSGLLAGREYDYAVTGSNSGGATQPATVAVQTVPGAVQNLDGTVNGTTISLLWDALGGAVATYNVYRGTSPGGEGATPIATGVTGTTYRDPNLVTGVTYYYVVTGTDAGGEGAASGELSALAAAPAPNLVISEFLADNKTGLTDAAGAHSDWIEVHNAGAGDADLSQYYLSDDAANPELWRFPVQTLPAGGYLIVWADGLNQAVAGQELHTNFSLGDAGEFLGLFGTNDVVQFQYAPAYPAQNADISYGLSDSDNPTGAVQFFGTPTPGAANAPTAQGAVFSQAGKTFSGTMTVTLTTATAGAQIRYTTDRTAPTSSSALYTGPITVAATTMVRARVFATGYTASVVTSQTYLDLGSTLSSYNSSGAAFSNNLGIVVIDTFGQALNDTTDVLAGATFIPASGGTASLTGATNYDGRIGLHIRGNTSEGFPKQQWGITLWDENNNNQKASLMGMPADSKWILMDPYSEKSLMQNPLAYKWASETGQYASRTQFVEVFLNTSGTATESYASNYWGVYVLEERVKIASGRVDINSMSPTDTTAPADTGGYIWEKDRAGSTDATFTTTLTGQQYIFVDPNANDPINSAQQAYLSGYVNQFEAALYGSNYKDATAGYAAYINVKSFVDTWLVEELIKNIDGFRLSSYYYKDENGKICAGPIWDNNLGLGNSNYYVNGGATNPLFLGSNPDGFDSAQLTDAEYPYYNRLFTDPAFKQAVTDEWSRLRATAWSTANLTADINNYTTLLSNGNGNYPVGAGGATPTQAPNNAVVRNFEKWPVLGVYGWPNGFYDPAGRWIEEVGMMKNWVQARVAWMDGQLLPGPAMSPTAGNQTSPTTVSLTPFTTTAADTVVLAAGAAAKAIVPTAAVSGWTGASYNDSSWTTGTSGVGYTTSSDTTFGSSIGLTAPMYNVNSTVYVRESFTVADPTAIGSLILQLRYSGGFVAYLNGTQIAYSNVSNSNDFATASYNSSATASRSDATALTYAEFDVSVFKDALLTGTNVLAIQGLNSSKTAVGFIVEPQLVSRVWAPATTAAAAPVYYTTDGSDPRNADGTVNAAAKLYTAGLALSANTTINARTYLNGTWSGLSSGIYQFAKPTLAVTELSFDPAKPATGSPYSNEDFEYIEFQNYGTSPVNLNGVTFTAGINYTFGNVALAPGQVGVLVHNTAAFQSRYGTTATILGDYQAANDSFSNGGETVTVVDALGNTLVNFTYVGTWFAAAHGGGSSMEVISPVSSLNLSLASSWQASTPTPGTIGLYLSGAAYLKMDAANQFLDVWTNATGTGAFAEAVAPSALTAITYTGAAAGSLTVDFSNGTPVGSAGLTFNGGSGSLSTLAVVGTAGNDTLTVGANTLGFTSALTGSVGLTYANAAAVTFNGGAGSDVLTQAATPGAGTLAFVNPTAADTLNVAAGTYAVPAPAAGSGIVKTTLGTVSISAGAALTVGTAAAHADRNLLVVGTLSLAGTTNAWTGKLDLGGNDLDVTNGSAATLANQVAQGSANASAGIVSSTAAANPTHLTTLGVLANSAANGSPLYNNAGPLGLFDGTSPAAGDTLVKYTYYGDADLNGVVNGADYTRLDVGYATGLTGWANGDVNYDGKVDGSDYTLIDNAFNLQAASLSPNVDATPAAELSPMVVTPAAVLATTAVAATLPFAGSLPAPVAVAKLAANAGTVVAPVGHTAVRVTRPAVAAPVLSVPFYAGTHKVQHPAVAVDLSNVVTSAV